MLKIGVLIQSVTSSFQNEPVFRSSYLFLCLFRQHPQPVANHVQHCSKVGQTTQDPEPHKWPVPLPVINPPVTPWVENKTWMTEGVVKFMHVITVHATTNEGHRPLHTNRFYEKLSNEIGGEDWSELSCCTKSNYPHPSPWLFYWVCVIVFL